ncbi:MAG: 5-formyltetrahydrofolate cyclo-ligase [Dermatophilaceae bacterium]
MPPTEDPNSPPLPAPKRGRRRALRARRRDIAAARNLAADGARLAHLALVEVERNRGEGPVTITAYEPLPLEPDVRALMRAAYERGMRVLVPVTLADLDLDWAQWSPDGLGAPLGKDAVAEVSVAFIPGLSVDVGGTRLGQGGGCYDKALPRFAPTAPVVCVLHPEEDLAEPRLPHEPHDRPVDGVLTADGLRWVGEGPADGDQ